jgi:hypothetical protein
MFPESGARSAGNHYDGKTITSSRAVSGMNAYENARTLRYTRQKKIIGGTYLSHGIRQRLHGHGLGAEPELNNSSDNYGTKRFLKEPSRKLKTPGATAVVATPSKNPFPPSPDFQLLIFRSRADEWDEWPRLALDATIRSRCRQDLDVDPQKKMQPRSIIFLAGAE